MDDAFKYLLQYVSLTICADVDPYMAIKDANRNASWYNFRKQLHRMFGPAQITYYPERQILKEKWYQNGLLHNNLRPAIVEYYKEGAIRAEMWYRNGIDHNSSGPAVIVYEHDGTIKKQFWHQYGETHNVYGPAELEYLNGEKIHENWYMYNKLHRISGPAQIRIDPYDDINYKTETWYHHGKLYHRNGPVLISYYKTGTIQMKEWYSSTILHRPNFLIQEFDQHEAIMKEYWYYCKTEPSRYNPGELYKSVVFNPINEDYHKIESWYEPTYFSLSELNRHYGPSRIKYYKNGTVHIKEWRQNNILHRDNGPASIEFDRHGHKIAQEWYHRGLIYSPSPIAYHDFEEDEYVRDQALDENIFIDDGFSDDNEKSILDNIELEQNNPESYGVWYAW